MVEPNTCESYHSLSIYAPAYTCTCLCQVAIKSRHRKTRHNTTRHRIHRFLNLSLRSRKLNHHCTTRPVAPTRVSDPQSVWDRRRCRVSPLAVTPLGTESASVSVHNVHRAGVFAASVELAALASLSDRRFVAVPFAGCVPSPTISFRAPRRSHVRSIN